MVDRCPSSPQDPTWASECVNWSYKQLAEGGKEGGYR